MEGAGRNRLVLWVLGAIVALGVGIRAAPGVASLLLASFILAYVCAPGVDFLERRRLPRGIGVVVVLLASGLVILGMVLLLVPVVVEQGRRVSDRLPDALAYTQSTVIPWVERSFGVRIPTNMASVADQLRTHLQSLGPQLASPISRALGKTFGGVAGFLAALANVLLIPVIAFYMARDYHQVWPRVEALVPPRHVERVREIIHDIDVALGGFVRGQLLVALILGVLKAIGLSIVHIDGAIVIGLLAGLLNMVPFLGSLISISLALLMALLQFSGWGPIVGVLVVFGVTQVLEQFVITPRIVGHSVGLSPVVVIVAVIAGGEIFGFVGVLLGVPAAAALKVLFGVARRAYLDSEAYRRAGSPVVAEKPPGS